HPPPPTAISTLSLHDALPIYHRDRIAQSLADDGRRHLQHLAHAGAAARALIADHHDVARLDLLARHRRERVLLAVEHARGTTMRDRKSTRLNSSHLVISYAVF